MQKKAYSQLFIIASLFIVPLFIGYLSVRYGQDASWDLRNYHLYNPYAFLNGRINYDLAPAGLQTYFNPFIDIIYIKIAGLLNAKAAGLVLGFLQGLNFIVLVGISRNLLNPLDISNKFSYFLALAGILTVGFMSEIGTTFHDSLLAILPLTSLWLITFNLSNIRSKTITKKVLAIFLAGLITGLGVGLKPVLVIFAISLVLSFFVLPISWLDKFKFSVLCGLGIIVGFLITGGYWTYLIWSEFGNPLFPQFNNIFHGGLAVPETFRDERFLPKSLFDKIFYPIIFTINPSRVSEIGFDQFNWIFLYIYLLAYFGVRLFGFVKKKLPFRPLTPEISFVITYFCIAYFFWMNIFGVYRYLISLELLIPLLLFVITLHLFESRRSIIVVILIVILTVVNLQGIPYWGRAYWTRPISRLDSSTENDLKETNPSIIFLGGQPSAWVIPLINPTAPVVQVFPNFPVSNEYWQRAGSIVDKYSAKDSRMFIILEPETHEIVEYSNKGLSNINLVIDTNSCKPFAAYIGQYKYEYSYCEVIKKLPDN